VTVLAFPVFPLSWKDETSGEQSLGFKERGFFSDAFVNMVALMGWASQEPVEIMSVENMIKDFSLERVHKAGAKFDFEKAKWFNHEYMKLKSGEELAAYLKPMLAEKKY
jgi:glutamyl-tRNA synthetase